MKNFTNNFKQFTSRLSARWLIIAFMLLLGTGSAWANGFWGDNAWNIKFYSPSQDKDMWINDNYDAGHGNGSTIDLGTFTSAPYLKGYWAKTWGYGNDTNKYVKVTFNNTTTSSGVSKQWDSNGDQMWKSESLNIKFPDTEGSHEESITFAINGAETMTCKIKYKICTSCCTNYYLQHPWNGGNWTWKELKKEDCNNNIYKLTANYGSAGCDYSKPGVQEKQDYIANPTLEGNPAKGDECIFTFDANKKTITITKVVTCNDNPDFSVSLSKSEVAVGCTGVTASIKGNDSPTVTWSSSSTNVATINNSTGAITIKAAGTTTITATTTEAGGFCGGVKKTATLTVKSPSVTVSANDNSLCEGETLTLTATLTNCGSDNSIQWYNGGNLINGATNTTLTINPVTTANSGNYKAVVSDGILCSAIESSINISVNALPSAPTNLGSATICNGDKTTLPEVTGSWYEGANTITPLASREVQPTKTTSYFATSKSNNCESSLRTEYVVTVKSLADANNYELTKTSEDYTGTTITLQTSDVNVNNNAGAVESIYFKQNGSNVTPINVGDYEVYVTTAATNDICAGNIKIGTFEITCPPIAAPDITASATVCAGTQVTLSNYNGNNTVKWYSNSACAEEVTEQITPTNNEVYYAKAYDEASDCYSSEYSTLTFKVNSLPNISISGNNSAVLYEDVELTAATDGTSISWEITEGDGSLSSTTGNSVTLTSSSAGNVTVTATATLGSCTATDTHEVEFSAENCADVTTTVEETVGKIKLLLSKPSWIGGSEKFYCYAWVNNTSTTLLGGWPGTELTQKEGDYYYVVVDANNKDIKIILNDNSEQTVDSDVLNANKIYQISATSSKNSDNKYTFNSKTDKGTYKESVTTTVPAPITAPAAKTISVSTTDGEGNIIFSGQVVKTGCDATNEYGFQYSSDQQTWTTVKVGENAAAGTAISNNTVNGLDGPYYVRAYITNDNSTQYGAIKEITVSTKKYPITTVTLTHVKNQAGDSYSAQELANLIYCVGDIVWFKLEQNGSNFQYYEWISYPGTELTGMYDGGMFKFKITESGNVGIRLRNDANVDGEGKPTWIESNLLEFNTHPEPTAPTISFATATICSTNNEGATLTLGATVSGQAYELWKYANDDDTEGSKVANVATLNCTENNQALQFTGIKTAGKYFVKTYYTAFCNTVIANSTHATLTVVNANDVHISISPATATTTPWMPVKLTVAASDDYTLEVPEGVEFNQNGNICSVKIPLPQGSTGGKEQYENVSFPQDATTSYTVTAKLVSTGGEDNPCAVPATATITLTPYEEECTIGH